jgi:small subunit ribosomal protein S6
MKKNFYEHTFIVNTVLDEADVKATIEKHINYLKDNGAELDEVSEWGIQRLAYDIDGKRSGFYVNAYFNAPTDLIAKFERQLQIDDNVIRYLTIKYDNKMLRHRELQKKGQIPEVFPEIPVEGEETEE